MTDDKQEPSAFPNGNLFPGNRGLTMRDAFAMNAPEVPQSFTRKWEDKRIVKDNGDILSAKRYTEGTQREIESYQDWVARWAYAYADAMMEARKK